MWVAVPVRWTFVLTTAVALLGSGYYTAQIMAGCFASDEHFPPRDAATLRACRSAITAAMVIAPEKRQPQQPACRQYMTVFERQQLLKE